MTPSVSGACTAPQTRNLGPSVSGSSTLTLPHGDRLAAQPDLGLFAATGFPYVGSAPRSTWPWPRATRLRSAPGGQCLPGWPNWPGAPCRGARRSRHASGRAQRAGDRRRARPVARAARRGAGCGRERGIAALCVRRCRPAASPSSWLQTVLNLLDKPARADEDAGASMLGVSRVHGQAELGRNGLITAFRAPEPGDHTVTVLTAAARPELWRAAEAAVSPAVWNQLGADVAVWRPGSDTVATERAGPVFHVGSRNTLYAARYYVGEYPLAWIGALLGSVLLLALVFRAYLARACAAAFPAARKASPDPRRGNRCRHCHPAGGGTDQRGRPGPAAAGQRVDPRQHHVLTLHRTSLRSDRTSARDGACCRRGTWSC